MSTEIIMPEQRRQAVVPISTDNSIMAVISRAAADPTCDIEKMERLLAMHERMQAKTAEQEFNAAMAEMQCNIPTVFEGAVNLHTGNSYATLDHNKSLDYRKYSGIKARLLIGVMDFHTRGVIPIYLHISMSIYWAFEIRSCDLESID